jgi:hypothetical protein
VLYEKRFIGDLPKSKMDKVFLLLFALLLAPLLESSRKSARRWKINWVSNRGELKTHKNETK